MSAKKYPDIQPGDRFGSWTVLSTHLKIHPNQPYQRYYAYCACDCGMADFVLEQNLKNGISTSCGCRGSRKKVLRPPEPEVKTPRVRKSHTSRLKEIWFNMKRRCYDSNNPMYSHYGARGIGICDEWRYDFKAFESWALSHGYSDDLSIDRIDGTKGYYPTNCRWATMEEQANNICTNRCLTYNGKTQSMARWSRELNIPTSTIYNRVRAGLTDEEILTLPRHYQQRKVVV